MKHMSRSLPYTLNARYLSIGCLRARARYGVYCCIFTTEAPVATWHRSLRSDPKLTYERHRMANSCCRESAICECYTTSKRENVAMR